MPTKRTASAFLVVILLAVGCASGSGSEPTSGAIRTGTFPTGSTDVVVRVGSCCGFTPVEYQLAIVPDVTIYGDGRIVMTGPVTEQYPGRALPNLRTGHADPAAIVDLLDRARAGGLLEPMDFGQPMITDTPTTTVIVNDGTEHEQSVYALGFDAAADAEDPAARDGGVSLGVTPKQRAARREVQQFVDAVTSVATRVANEPYDAESVRVFVRPTSASTGEEAVASGTETWLLGDLADFGTSSPLSSDYRCGVLAGTDAATALAAAETATTITRWRSVGAEYSIVWRPLLPDEHTCPVSDGVAD